MLTRVCGVALATALLLAPVSPTADPDTAGQETTDPTATVSSGPVTYYVVGPAVNGQPEYLFAIAAATLGDGNRMQEIFALNEGRPQPYGRTMTDPTRLEPGWVLLLPPDAAGPGVLVGDLPPLTSPTPDAEAQSPDRPGRAGPDALQVISGVLLVAVVGLVTTALLLLRVRSGT